MPKTVSIPIKVFGQEFKIKAGTHEKELLESVARLVTEKIENLSKDSSVSTERIAIMTAFQFAFELKQKEKTFPQKKSDKSVQHKIDSLIKRIERAVKD